jgi:hypothetical protein
VGREELEWTGERGKGFLGGVNHWGGRSWSGRVITVLKINLQELEWTGISVLMVVRLNSDVDSCSLN